MKHFFSLFAALCAAVTIYAAERVVWTGNEPISWNTEVYAGTQFETPSGTFDGLSKDQTIKVTVVPGIDEPQYVMTYKAGTGWEWTDLAAEVAANVMSYTVESEQIATEIAERGLIFRGQGYNITAIVVDDNQSDEPVTPQPQVGETVLFEGSKVLGAAGEDNIGIDADKFATLAVKDSIVVTITDLTDTYCQLNIAANTGWVVIPGTEWSSLTAAGRYAYAVGTNELVTAIKDGGVTVQGKLCTITKITLSPYVEPGDTPVDPQPTEVEYTFTDVWTGDQAISWNQNEYPGSEMETYNVKQDMFAGLAQGDSIKVYFAQAIEGAQFNLTYKAGEGWTWTELTTTTGADYFGYKVATEQIAQEIADRGVIVRGQGYHAVRIAVGKPKDTASSVVTTQQANAARKIIENGQVLIIKDGIRYSILGTGMPHRN